MRGANFDVALTIKSQNLKAAIDAAALETVLITVCENAQQAGASLIQIEATAKARDIHIALSDNGPGIAAGDRERLFEPFFTTHRADGGTGLGLSIARALVEAHKGRLELLDSEAGACFRIMLMKA
jgi:signal transduction histidine kinase